jgi:hypothetical protein
VKIHKIFFHLLVTGITQDFFTAESEVVTTALRFVDFLYRRFCLGVPGLVLIMAASIDALNVDTCRATMRYKIA